MHFTSRSLSCLSMTLLAMLSCFGCATNSNEGAIDYRKAVAPTQQGTAGRIEFLHKDKEALPAGRIEKLDKISIRLRDGFLADCHEARWKKNPFRGGTINCEIGILVRVFELGETQDFNFKPGAEHEARLVYFSHDVQPGQFFNMHNLPVYGPIEYRGRPLGVDVFIMEVDADDPQALALLKSLASVGATAFAPASPALNVLNELGTSLLNSGTDDINFRYSFVLDPAGGYSGPLYAAPEAGDYVFMRTEQRDEPIPWGDLRLDPDTGRVWMAKPEQLYRSHTYLTLQLLKNAGSDDVSLAQNTFGDFIAALDRDSAQQADALQKKLQPALEQLIEHRVQKKTFNSLQRTFEQMVRCKDEGCTDRCYKAAFDVHTQVTESTKRLKCPNNPSDTNSAQQSKGSLSLEQVEYLLRRMSEHEPGRSAKHFGNFTAECKKGFLELNFEDFAKLMCE